MTKFVAVLFLPLVLGLAGLVAPPSGDASSPTGRIWLGVTALVAALVLPWFLWATSEVRGLLLERPSSGRRW